MTNTTTPPLIYCARCHVHTFVYVPARRYPLLCLDCADQHGAEWEASIPTWIPANGSTITVTYDPRYIDDGDDLIIVGTTSDRTPDGFDFTPADGAPSWSIMVAEIERGIVALDPKQLD